MALREFKLPDPGEGLTEAELVTWHVAVGDTVKVNDIVVEVETAKSLVELPVPFAGTVASLHAAEGDTVEVGTVIITIDDGVGGSPDAVAPAPAAAAAPAPRPQARRGPGRGAIGEGLIGGTTSTGRTAVLVGYGVKQTEAKRRPRAGAMPAKVEAPDLSVARAPTSPSSRSRLDRRGAHPDGRAHPRAGQAAGAQAGQGPRRRPRHGHPDRRRRHRHPRRRRGGGLGSAAPRHPTTWRRPRRGGA